MNEYFVFVHILYYNIKLCHGNQTSVEDKNKIQVIKYVMSYDFR